MISLSVGGCELAGTSPGQFLFGETMDTYALMLDYLGWRSEAAAIEAAVRQAVVSGNGTRDVGGSLGTNETGDYVAKEIKN